MSSPAHGCHDQVSWPHKVGVTLDFFFLATEMSQPSSQPSESSFPKYEEDLRCAILATYPRAILPDTSPPLEIHFSICL